MPREFRPLSIPMGSGARQDKADLVTDAPQALQVAENVVFTREGAVRARPGRTERSTETLLTYDDFVNIAGNFEKKKAA